MTIMELYKGWYSRLDVQFEIIKFLKFRETVFLTKKSKVEPVGSRMHKIHSTQHFQLNMTCLPYRINHPYNIYHSVARFKEGIPHQTLNFYDKSRSEINHNWKHGGYIDNIYAYDFVIDIDAPSHDEMYLAKESAIKLHRLYMYHGIEHEIRFTGMGFHFIVRDHGSWTDNYNPNTLTNIYNAFANLARILYSEVSEMIDLKIYDSRRVIKCPYTLSVYDDKAYLCYPFLTSKELYDFDYRKMLIQKPTDFSKIIKGRGTFRFNQGNDPVIILDPKWQHALQEHHPDMTISTD